MKKHLAVTAVSFGIGCAVLLSGCAGCNGSNKNVAALSSNWYANTAYKKIQPTFTEGNEYFGKDGFGMEKIIYKVTFDDKNASNKVYSLSYGEGTYTTEFYATEFDRDTYTHADFKGGYPDRAPVVYCYKTVLDISSVTFKMGDDEEVLNGDKVETLSYFLSVENYLQPLYTYQKIKSATPAELQVSSLKDAYELVDCEYVTYYSFDGTAAKTFIKDNDGQRERSLQELDKAANTVLDTAYLDIAARATKLNGSFSQAVSLNTPASGLQNFTLSGSSATLSDEEKPAVKAVLESKNLYKPAYNDDETEKDFVTAVTVNYNGAHSGVSQTYYFAAIHNSRNNAGRATMLKLSVPLSFGLGTLNYTIDNIESTLWNN